MAPTTKAWAHLGALGALGAYSPSSAPRARVCNDYTELAPDAPDAPTGCELIHDWQAIHPRRDRGGPQSLPALHQRTDGAANNRIRDLNHGGQ